mgnify:CR=1 FL=1
MMVLVEVDDPSQVGRNEKKRFLVHNMKILSEHDIPFLYSMKCDISEVLPATFENRKVKGLNKNAK